METIKGIIPGYEFRQIGGFLEVWTEEGERLESYPCDGSNVAAVLTTAVEDLTMREGGPHA